MENIECANKDNIVQSAAFMGIFVVSLNLGMSSLNLQPISREHCSRRSPSKRHTFFHGLI